jgi:DNA-binding CsgD family transcriptional regulator
MNGAPRCPLTPRQLQALELLSEGLVYKQIAVRMGIGISTVRTFLHGVYLTLGVPDRAQAVLIAAQHGWIDGGVTLCPEDRTLLAAYTTAIRDLVDVTEERGKLTSRQHAVCDALDDVLRSRSDDGTRERFDTAFVEMMAEAGVNIRENRRPRDPVEAILEYAADVR